MKKQYVIMDLSSKKYLCNVKRDILQHDLIEDIEDLSYLKFEIENASLFGNETEALYIIRGAKDGSNYKNAYFTIVPVFI